MHALIIADSIEFSKVVTLSAVGLDVPNSNENAAVKLNELLQRFIEKGVVQPLPRTVFGTDEIKVAYRYCYSL